MAVRRPAIYVFLETETATPDGSLRPATTRRDTGGSFRPIRLFPCAPWLKVSTPPQCVSALKSFFAAIDQTRLTLGTTHGFLETGTARFKAFGCFRMPSNPCIHTDLCASVFSVVKFLLL